MCPECNWSPANRGGGWYTHRCFWACDLQCQGIFATWQLEWRPRGSSTHHVALVIPCRPLLLRALLRTHRFGNTFDEALQAICATLLTTWPLSSHTKPLPAPWGISSMFMVNASRLRATGERVRLSSQRLVRIAWQGVVGRGGGGTAPCGISSMLIVNASRLLVAWGAQQVCEHSCRRGLVT